VERIACTGAPRRCWSACRTTAPRCPTPYHLRHARTHRTAPRAGARCHAGGAGARARPDL